MVKITINQTEFQFLEGISIEIFILLSIIVVLVCASILSIIHSMYCSSKLRRACNNVKERVLGEEQVDYSRPPDQAPHYDSKYIYIYIYIL